MIFFLILYNMISGLHCVDADIWSPFARLDRVINFTNFVLTMKKR